MGCRVCPSSPVPHRVRHDRFRRGEALLGVLDEIAAAHDVPVAAVSPAWLAAQRTVAAPIASARTLEQLHAILPTLQLRLSDDEVGALTST